MGHYLGEEWDEEMEGGVWGREMDGSSVDSDGKISREGGE